ncbi:hypothetical protein [Acidovorax sp. sic0104]|uniref:hypothetical protein n=1 Tax=Acidovorax sp. sic0104 TaxID=2854784 RepID=UPI001C43E774|nr:hypothetical protein [Acidovorax sp. sic0104]MBV7542136.1 hypothetical protein [Acidovorax sp. sic0104]
MFSLIISIVSIALVVALAAATMYYGGDALTQGRSSAEASAYVTGAQQIGGAAVMHITTQPAPPAAVADLVTSGMMSGIPNVKSRSETNEWTLVPGAGPTTPRMLRINLAGAATGNQKLCDQINRNAGGTGMSAADGTVTELGALPYACVPGATGTDPQVFQFKY